MKEEKTSLPVVLPSLSILHPIGTAGEPTKQRLGAISKGPKLHVTAVIKYNFTFFF